MKVIIVDDEESFAEMLKELVLVEGHDAEAFHSLRDAYDALEDIEEPMVILLDHDFGDSGEQDQLGYDLCKWLREKHPFGLLLPVIYLSGREVPDRFLNQQRKEPFFHPNAYISKEQLATDQDLIPNLLKSYEKQFEQICELFEKQSAQQALIGFRDMDPEEFDTYETE